jgi:hypothetical protein
VLGRRIEDVVPGAFPLEEDDVERRGQAERRVAQIEPDLGRIDAVGAVELLDVARRAEDDVDPAAVGPPAGARRRAPEDRVGVIEAAVVLLLEFVPRRSRGGIAVFPERLDEDVPLAVGLELAENLPLVAGDDVNDLFVEPLLEPLGKGLRLGGRVLLLRGRDGSERGQEDRQGEGPSHCGPHNELL